MEAARRRIPRDPEDDYTGEAAEKRQAFIEEETGVDLQHMSSYSFDPSILQGNVENFTGVAQVPIGFAGPLLVDGEHAQGEFYVPLATAEGTLVASYNRGMRLLHEGGGVRTTVLDDRMQRAPAFLFADAREARTFADWLDERFDDIRHAAKATQAACDWIKANYEGALEHYFLESNFATDKKSSQVNILRTRGKRVVAEATIPRDLIKELMHADVDMLWRARLVSNLGGFMSGVNNNGAHSANGITAMFIATGQDVANVAESSAALNFSEVLPNGDYYVSITIPSLIVATYGGGTGLATQRECLEVLGCYGKGKVMKLAEIVAATVLCGELSLGSAIVAEQWVHAHDLHGRNRP